jgi:hypothetical protein
MHLHGAHRSEGTENVNFISDFVSDVFCMYIITSTLLSWHSQFRASYKQGLPADLGIEPTNVLQKPCILLSTARKE